MVKEKIIRRIVLTGMHPERGIVVLGLIDEHRNWYPHTRTLPAYEEFIQDLLKEGFEPQRTPEQLDKSAGGQVYFDLKVMVEAEDNDSEVASGETVDSEPVNTEQ